MKRSEGPVEIGTPNSNLRNRLARIRHVALDMDGTIYNGGSLFKTTVPFLGLLGKIGISHTFITNNSSRSVADYVLHLQKMGLAASADQLHTSAQGTIACLKHSWPALKRLFVLGTGSMSEEFRLAGYIVTSEGPNDEPDAVVVGFDPTMTYERLGRAAWWIRRGKPYFATNPDRVCPTDEPTVLVDCGSICAALREATGCAPTAVMGKPDPAMLQAIMDRHALEPDQLAMVGDRLYTDITMARRADVLGVLVLTGEATAAEAASHLPPPDLVVAGLFELGGHLRDAKSSRGLENPGSEADIE